MVKFKMSLSNYCDFIYVCDNSDYPTAKKIKDYLESNTRIINEDMTSDEDLLVEIKCESTMINPMLMIATHHSALDFDIKELSSYIRLKEEFELNVAERKKREAAQREYKQWLDNCFDKYVVNKDTPSCKEIADMINQNDLKPNMKPIKYQNIIRSLNEYRRKF